MTGAHVPFIAVVPARRASTRLPDKPLAEIAGKPMVIHVAARAAASGASRVIVATDDDAIADTVRRHGFEPMITRADHASGTDRIAEVVARLALDDDAIVVNVQGDEPLIDPALIARATDVLDGSHDCAIATPCHAITTRDDAFNPNIVKVARDAAGRALYFSRAPIPWARGDFDGAETGPLPRDAMLFRHVGLYAYRASFLKAFTSLPISPLETQEALEQLRALWHGYRIAVFVCDTAPAPGVDTAEDLEHVRALVALATHPERRGGDRD